MKQDFHEIKKCFLSGVNVVRINFDCIENISWDGQEKLINSTVLHQLNQRHPLKIEYQVTFLKNLIRELEKRNINEIHDLIYEQLTLKLEIERSEFSFKHFIMADDDAVTIKESNSFIRDGTTGLVLWPAAIALTDFVLQHSMVFRDKTILEIGSGASGFVGISLVRHCIPRRMIMSDCHGSVIKTLMENVRINFEKFASFEDDRTVNLIDKIVTDKNVEIGILDLPWEDAQRCKEDLLQIQPNVLLAADVIYDDTIFDALIGCLKEIFQLFSGIDFYLSQTIRNEDTFNKFCQLLEENGFAITNQNFEQKFFDHLITEDSGKIKILKINQ